MSNYILAIDQGTTSSRAIVFRQDLTIAAVSQREFTQHFPQSGWVEHDANEIWASVLSTCRDAIAKAGLSAGEIASIGITNQRETVVVWDKDSGQPLHNAIVWQDRRTADDCKKLVGQGHEPLIGARTGLLLDPYFSGSKLKWILDHVDGARASAQAGNVLFGTIDTWLVWKLTGGAVHATDATNASRTMLYNIHTNQWDGELLDLFDIPAVMLPDVLDSADDFGATTSELFDGAIKILGVAGDQQAASVGQACFAPGMIKSTYGTGCFAMLNTGNSPVTSNNRLLTTIAYRLNGETTYALEGSIFMAGATVQWLRDGLKIIESAPQTQSLAQDADDTQDVYLVPAFVGFGAPHWDAHARGAIYGLTRNTGPAELARAALESVGYQTRDLLEAMQGDWEGLSNAETVLRVDGGMTASDWAMSFLSSILSVPVDRPQTLETTALGVAYLAGWKAGICPDPEGFAQTWALERRFEPDMDSDVREAKYKGWQDAVRRTLSS
ncbi:glycerol kinase GlpK [Magnetovibrio sp. PR-2]|uniref:glycerol kinase GlpK n=1 Tax=Magnetovibrio sp. PR-2 TaxID=3120356 RepID=UPI002FCE1931